MKYLIYLIPGVYGMDVVELAPIKKETEKSFILTNDPEHHRYPIGRNVPKNNSHRKFKSFEDAIRVYDEYLTIKGNINDRMYKLRKEHEEAISRIILTKGE